MATHDTFRDWLQRELEQRGWSQADLARHSRLTTAQVSRLMTGEQHPGPVAGQKIARALHLPPETVFRHAGLLPAAPATPEGAEELLYHYTHLAPADRRRLLAIARSLRALQEEG